MLVILRFVGELPAHRRRRRNGDGISICSGCRRLPDGRGSLWLAAPTPGCSRRRRKLRFGASERREIPRIQRFAREIIRIFAFGLNWTGRRRGPTLRRGRFDAEGAHHGRPRVIRARHFSTIPAREKRTPPWFCRSRVRCDFEFARAGSGVGLWRRAVAFGQLRPAKG